MPSEPMMSRSRLHILPAAAGIIAICSILCLPSIRTGEFWHSDSSRHAMNGVFIMDFLTDESTADGVIGAAEEYYSRYPALSLPYHPPLFPLFEVLFFKTGGVTTAAARAAVFVFFLAAAGGLYWGVRLFAGSAAAILTTFLFITLPYTKLLAGSVLLEMPVLAFFIPGIFCFARFVKNEEYRFLYASGGLLILACYMKQTAVFAAFLMLGMLIVSGKAALLKDRRVLAVTGISAVLLMPLLILTVRFSPGLLAQAAGGVGRMDRLSPEGLTYYMRQLPLQIGWGLIGGGWLFLSLMLKKALAYHREGLLISYFTGMNIDWIAVSWIVSCWIFFNFLSVKYPRHTVYWIPAWCMAAAWAGEKLRIRNVPLGRILIAVLIAAQFFISFNYQRPFVSGPRTAAEIVVRQPGDKNIMYGGYFNGNFAFHVRSLDHHRTCRIFRVSRSFMDIPVMQHFGYTENMKNVEEVSRFLGQNGISYLVLEEHHGIKGRSYALLKDIAGQPAWELMTDVPLRDSEKGYRPNRILIYRRWKGGV